MGDNSGTIANNQEVQDGCTCCNECMACEPCALCNLCCSGNQVVNAALAILATVLVLVGVVVFVMISFDNADPESEVLGNIANRTLLRLAPGVINS